MSSRMQCTQESPQHRAGHWKILVESKHEQLNEKIIIIATKIDNTLSCVLDTAECTLCVWTPLSNPSFHPHNEFISYWLVVCAQLLSHVRLFAIPRTVACQVPLSMVFPRPEYWSGLPFPPPGDLPKPEIEHSFPESSALAGKFFTTEPPGKP